MTEPSKDWIEDCLEVCGKVLTGGKAHWCPDWDFLPIDETCPEIDGCVCYSGQSKNHQGERGR